MDHMTTQCSRKGSALARNTTSEDFSNSLGMLHSTVTDMRSEMRTSLREGFDGVTSAGERAHQEAAEAVNAELSRMRADMRGAQKAVLTREDIADVQRTLDLLRDDVEAVKQFLTPPLPTETIGVLAAAPDISSQANGALRPADIPAPAPAHSGHATPAGVTDIAAIAVSEDALRASAAADALPAENPPDVPEPTSGEQLARALLNAVREELRPVHALEDLGDRLAALQEAAAASARELAAAQADRKTFGEQLAALEKSITGLPSRQVIEEQVSALRGEVAALAEILRAAQLPREDGAEWEEQQVGLEEHKELLSRAARVSTARLVCHRDTWEFLTSRAAHHPHFRMPPRTADHGEHRVAADLSGRSLIAVLITLRGTRHADADDDGDWALASTAYQRVATVLADLADEGGLVTITLDDRTPSSPESGEGPAGSGNAPGHEATGTQPDDGPLPDTGRAPGGPEA